MHLDQNVFHHLDSKPGSKPGSECTLPLFRGHLIRDLCVGSRRLLGKVQPDPCFIGETDAEGQQWFAAFGKRANSSTGVAMSEGAIRQFTALHSKRGYTGQEHADPVGLIHMNDRMFDPMTGRFLQADPFVQDPMSLQSLNRYSYVLNNPFAYTDPSGYWGKKEQGYLRTAVAVAITVWTGYYIDVTTLTTAQAVSVAAAGGAAAGAVATGTMRGAVIGACSGAIGGRIGASYQAGSYQNVLASATLGGITAELGGGRFGHGFFSAGLSEFIAPQINVGNTFGQGVAHAMLGGTMSAISGGEFANGVITSAFAYSLGRAANNRSYGSNKSMKTYGSVSTAGKSGSGVGHDPFDDLSHYEKVTIALEVVAETCPPSMRSVPSSFEIGPLPFDVDGATSVFRNALTFSDEFFDFPEWASSEGALEISYHETMHRDKAWSDAHYPHGAIFSH